MTWDSFSILFCLTKTLNSDRVIALLPDREKWLAGFDVLMEPLFTSLFIPVLKVGKKFSSVIGRLVWDKESLNLLTFTTNLLSVKLITTWLLVRKSRPSRGIER